MKPKTVTWIGRVVSALVVGLLLFSATMKFLKPADIVTEMTRLGYPERLTLAIGIIELACVVLYAIPQTAVLGAILLTGYLGGATATHVRIGDPWFGPIIIGIVLWIALYLREPRLRALAPLRR